MSYFNMPRGMFRDDDTRPPRMLSRRAQHAPGHVVAPPGRAGKRRCDYAGLIRFSTSTQSSVSGAAGEVHLGPTATDFDPYVPERGLNHFAS